MGKNMVDIFERYEHEIDRIDNMLMDLENGKIYEIMKKPGIPKCSTAVERLRSEISDLLHKINNGEEGFQERMSNALQNFKLRE